MRRLGFKHEGLILALCSKQGIMTVIKTVKYRLRRAEYTKGATSIDIEFLLITTAIHGREELGSLHLQRCARSFALQRVITSSLARRRRAFVGCTDAAAVSF